MNSFIKGITVRDMTEPDLRQVYLSGMEENEFTGLNPAWNAENLSAAYASEKKIALCAVRRKKITGFIIGSAVENETVLLWLFVDSRLRHKGIGRMLLNSLSELTENRNRSFLSVPLIPENHSSTGFFLKNGFSTERCYVRLTSEKNIKKNK